ncbi:MAG: DUF6788 family protein [Acidimicrobiales bacterium]
MAGRKQDKVPKVVRGTVLVHSRRCGKPNCRCAAGEAAHESTVLSYKERGKTRFLMLPADEVEAVRVATARFRSAKARVEEEGNAGLAELVARIGRSKTS